MFSLKFTSMSLVALAFAGGTAFAATGAMSSHHKMAPSEVKTLKECQSMKHSAMIKDRNCLALQKKYPSAMKQGSSTATTNGNAVNGGTMKKKSSTGGGGPMGASKKK